ncbi:MAG: type II toxin-antitoxin system RelE/ParE family toxin [Opitutaceae bacterium]|jgi:plasmid stabilization system protein ParE
MKFTVSARTKAELVEIADYYGAIRPGLAVQLTAAFDEACGRAVASPLVFREREDGVRVVLLRRFPYRLRFQFNESRRTLRVLSLTHTARKPE